MGVAAADGRVLEEAVEVVTGVVVALMVVLIKGFSRKRVNGDKVQGISVGYSCKKHYLTVGGKLLGIIVG